MKITSVEAIPLFASFAEALDGDVPPELTTPAYSMRRNPLLGQGAVIVRVTTDAGLVGIGEAMGRPGPAARQRLSTKCSRQCCWAQTRGIIKRYSPP